LTGFEVRITVDSIIPGIAPGVNVNVEFILLQKNNVLAVPYHYVKKQDSLSTIDILRKDNQGKENIVSVNIKTGLTDYKHFEIITGLNEGDIVVFKPEINEGKSK